jgi:HTH-type transcriptional regulator, cell division transcriptional repressor
MPSTAVYLVLPSSMARFAASLMFSGVSKSGSPAPRPITSLAGAFSSRALLVTAIVGDGFTRDKHVGEEGHRRARGGRHEREELAQAAGREADTLGAWEDDVAEPRGNKLQMVAGMLNVSIRWLLTGVGEGVDPPSDATLDPALAAHVTEALTEVQNLRMQLSASADRLGTVEARLRALLKAA